MGSDRAAPRRDSDCLYPDTPFRVILPTTQGYYWELGPFFELFNRYWGPDQEVVVLGDGDPGLDYPNLTYFDMPARFREDNRWTMNFFATGIRWYLKEHVPETHFVMMQTDFWLTEPVDLAVLAATRAYMERHDHVIRVGICNWPGAYGSPFLEQVGAEAGVTFWRCQAGHPDCFLQMSNIPAMWNRDRLCEVWTDGWDSWACEQWGGQRLLTMPEFKGYRSVLCRPRALTWNHVSYTRYKRVVLANLSAENREIVRPFVPGSFEVV